MRFSELLSSETKELRATLSQHAKSLNALLQKHEEAGKRADEIHRETEAASKSYDTLIQQIEATLRQMALLAAELKKNREAHEERQKGALRQAREKAKELGRKVEDARGKNEDIKKRLRQARLDALKKYLLHCEDVSLRMPTDVHRGKPASIEVPYAYDSQKQKWTLFAPVSRKMWDDVSSGDLGPACGNAAELLWNLFVATGMNNRNSRLVAREDFVEIRTSVPIADSPRDWPRNPDVPGDAALVLLTRLPQEVEEVALHGNA